MVDFSAILYKGDNFCDLFCLPSHQTPSEKWSALKGKHLLPQGANSFLLVWTPFQKGAKLM